MLLKLKSKMFDKFNDVDAHNYLLHNLVDEIRAIALSYVFSKRISLDQAFEFITRTHVRQIVNMNIRSSQSYFEHLYFITLH